KVGINFTTEQEKDAKEQFEKMIQFPDAGGDSLTKFLEGLKTQSTSQASSGDASSIARELAKALEPIIAAFKVVEQKNQNLADMLVDEKKKREDAIKVQQDADKAAKTKKVTDALDKAEKEGKFPKADRDKWSKRLEENFDDWNSELEAKPVSKEFQSSKQNQQQQQQAGGGEQKKNPREILRNEIATNMDSGKTV
ncbi:MAG: hypothetical protein AB1394_13425, partial [Bacteroidota bacterium]